MLLNLETSRDKLLQIVLVGQPELEERLKRPELRQVKQRIALRCKTSALTLEETHNYIQTRLHIAGANGKPIFAREAMDAVSFYSRGIPRVINLLCENALMNAYVEDLQPVPESIVAEVAQEFQFDDIKPVVASMDFGHGSGSNLIALQSTPGNATVSMPATAEQPYQRHSGALANRVSGPFAVAGALPSAASEPAVPVPDCERMSVIKGTKEAFSSSEASATALAAPEPELIEARKPAELIPFLSDAGIQSFFGLTMEPAPLSTHPLAYEFEIRKQVNILPDPNRFQVSSSQKFAHPPTKIGAPKLGAFRSRLIELNALHEFLVRWGTKWGDRLLSALTSCAQTQRTAILFQRWRDKSLTIVGSTDWSQMKASAFRWLQQPVNLTQWRMPYSRVFEARHRLSHKKM